MNHPRIALLLVGHGSADTPLAGRPILELADLIRARNRFDDVAVCFMKQEPWAEGALDRLSSTQVIVVPVFAGRGHYTDTLVPAALKLAGRPGVIVTAPVGAHPAIPTLLAARARSVAKAAGLDSLRAGLLLIAHGSSRTASAGETPRTIAQAIEAAGGFAQVALAFLEQEPRAESWPDLIATPDVVVLPLLMAQGAHASRDIPALFADAKGRRILIAVGQGVEAELADIVIAMAETALRG